MTDPPLVSIGMQIFNNERSVARAIRSVLAQTYAHWELIVHDDGSTDRSFEIASEFSDPRIVVARDTSNRKRAFRINQSLRLAQGEFYALMDADDVAFPFRIERQLAALRSHPSIDLLGADMVWVDPTGLPLGRLTVPQLHADICRHPARGILVAHPTFMGRTAWFRKHWYDESYHRAQDQEFLLRTYRYSEFANLPEILVAYSLADSSLHKTLRTRYWHCRSIAAHLMRGELILEGLGGLVREILVAVLDIGSCALGLRRASQHRALVPLTASERITLADMLGTSGTS